MQAYLPLPTVLCVGRYEAFWLHFLLPRTASQELLPDADWLYCDIPSQLSALLSCSPDHHPVILELGVEHNCGPSFLPLLQKTFAEYKFEVPFVSHKSLEPQTSGLLYKKMIYLANTPFAYASGAMYDISAQVANSVPVSLDDGKGSVIVINKAKRPVIEFAGDVEDGISEIRARQLLQFYKEMFSGPWVGENPGLCGEHVYDWDHGVEQAIRHVKGTVTLYEDLDGWTVLRSQAEAHGWEVGNAEGSSYIKIPVEGLFVPGIDFKMIKPRLTLDVLK